MTRTRYAAPAPQALELPHWAAKELRRLARRWPDGRARLTIAPMPDGTIAVTDTYAARFYDADTITGAALLEIVIGEPVRMAATFTDDAAALPGERVTATVRLKCAGADAVALIGARRDDIARSLTNIIEGVDRHQSRRLLDILPSSDPVQIWRTFDGDPVAITATRLAPFADLAPLELFAVGSHKPVAVHDERGTRWGVVMPTRHESAPHWESPTRSSVTA